MEQGHIVLDNCSLTDNNSSGMVEHDAATNFCRRVNVYAEGDANLVLEKLSQGVSIGLPQPVGDSMCLQGMVRVSR